MSDLPDGWTIATIKELAGTTGLFVDGDWIESKDQDPNGSIRLLQLADIGDSTFLDKSDRWINEDAFGRLRCTELATGDVLVARMPDPLGRACLMPALGQRCVTVVDVAVLRVDSENIDKRWVMQTINSPQIRTEIATQSSGTTRRRISRGRLGEMEIPLPPKAEQTRIANQLDTLLTRIQSCNDRFDAIPALLKRFRRAALLAATSGELTCDWRAHKHGANAANEFAEVSVGDPFSHTIRAPKLWRKSTLGEVCEFVGGSQPPKSTFTYQASDDVVRLIQIRDYKSDRHTTYIPKNLARRFCSETDVMIGRYGPPIFQILRGLQGAYNVALIKAVPRSSDIDLEYLYAFLRGDQLLKYVEAGSDRTAGQDGVRKELLTPYPIFLPSKAEQAEIVRRVAALFALADRIEARAAVAQAHAQRLSPLVLAKAFRGELVPQDPNDEPASALLARIASSNTAVAGKNKQKVPVTQKNRAQAAIDL